MNILSPREGFRGNGTGFKILKPLTNRLRQEIIFCVLTHHAQNIILEPEIQEGVDKLFRRKRIRIFKKEASEDN